MCLAGAFSKSTTPNNAQDAEVFVLGNSIGTASFCLMPLRRKLRGIQAERNVSISRGSLFKD